MAPNEIQTNQSERCNHNRNFVWFSESVSNALMHCRLSVFKSNLDSNYTFPTDLFEFHLVPNQSEKCNFGLVVPKFGF